TGVWRPFLTSCGSAFYQLEKRRTTRLLPGADQVRFNCRTTGTPISWRLPRPRYKLPARRQRDVILTHDSGQWARDVFARTGRRAACSALPWLAGVVLFLASPDPCARRRWFPRRGA